MEAKKIFVVGSTNMDMVVKTSHIPVPGETVLAGSFFMNPGGKGANQAVAIARLGGDVAFVSRVGNDVFGKQSSRLLDDEGINTLYMTSDEQLPSGVALITVDEVGENSIVVASGANGNFLPQDLDEALAEITRAGIVLMQLEIPLETVSFVAKYAASKGVKVVLNPAPATALSLELLGFIDLIIPNQHEAEMISGIKVKNTTDAARAAKAIHEMGVKNVVITLGALGAVVCEGGEIAVVSATKVSAIDTTAAGDAFCGALVVGISESRSLLESVEFACKVAGMSVMRLGAQSSMPYRYEVIAAGL